MPLAYGGGIQTMEDAERLFALGVEKVCLHSALFQSPSLVRDLAARFGSQAVMACLNVKRSLLGRPTLYASGARRVEKGDWIGFARNAVESGVGELLLYAVDRDGTMRGYDEELVREASAAVPVPIVALGGAGQISDLRAVVNAGASAAAAGAFFVFQGPHRAVLITYPMYSELERLFG